MARRKPFFETNSEPLDQRIVTGLGKVGLALKHQGFRSAGGRGLSPTQSQILAMLAGAGAGLRPSTIADRLAVSAPTVTDSVRALVAKGLADKARDPNDARATLVRLTDDGRREAQHAAAWPDFLLVAVDEMAVAEQEAFFSGLVKMIKVLQARGEIPISTMCMTCRYFRPHAHEDEERPHHCAFVDAPMGARHLRLECDEHEAATEPEQDIAWERFRAG